jgi:hypothetical protein
VAKLQGLTGLYGPVPLGEQGRDPREFGTTADPRHAVPGDASVQGHDYLGTAYGPVINNDAKVASTPLQGLVVEQTPDSHAAPYPRGLTHDPLVAAAQMRTLHGLDLGGPRSIIGTVPTPYDQGVQQSLDDSPNASGLAAGLPRQLRVGTDVDQGDGTTPGYGFGFGHLFRRVMLAGVPRNWAGTVRGERPFLGRHSVAQARFDGPDSPYGTFGDTSTGMGNAPTPTGDPTPYTAAPNPTVQPNTGYALESGFTGGWMAG